MTDLDFLAIGLAVDQPQFARDAHIASGMGVFAEIAEGKVGTNLKAFRQDLDRQGRGSRRVSSAFPIYEAVLRALKARADTERRTNAVAALLQGDARTAMGEIQSLLEQPAKLKVVS